MSDFAAARDLRQATGYLQETTRPRRQESLNHGESPPHLSPSRANRWVGIRRSRPSQGIGPHRKRRTPLWEQAGVSEGNEGRCSQGYRRMVHERTGPTCFLVERPRRDWKINHRPNVRRNNLYAREARCQLLLFARLRGPQQSSENLSDACLPTRLSISRSPNGDPSGLKGAPRCCTRVALFADGKAYCRSTRSHRNPHSHHHRCP